MFARTAIFTLVLTLNAGAPIWAAEDPAFSRDLTATIALQGQPCDKLINTKRNGDSDYTVSCMDGNRYHVFVNAQGRVIVQKM